MIKPVDALPLTGNTEEKEMHWTPGDASAKLRPWEMPQQTTWFFNQYIARENKEIEKEPVD